MNKRDLKIVEQKLLEDRERLLKEIKNLDESFRQSLKDSAGDLSAYSVHMADLGSDAFEREMNDLRSSTEGQLLFETMDALRRLYRDEYGLCLRCEKKIGRDRLLTLPQARLCLDCKTLEERGKV